MRGTHTSFVRSLIVLIAVGCMLASTTARCSPSDYTSTPFAALAKSVGVASINGTTALPPTTLSFNKTNASCYNAKNGSATVIPSGGNGPYTYLWSNGKTTATINLIGAGTYTVTVTDVTGATTVGSVTITQPAQIIAYTNCIHTCPGVCNGSSTVTVLGGGTPPYTYNWSTGATTATIGSLCPGVYWVTVTDANNCKKILAGVVSQSSAINISGSVANPLCNGLCTGTITQTITGGMMPYTYNWSDNGSIHTKNRSGLCAGVYSVTVIAANGCTATNTYTVSAPAPLNITLTPTNPPCYGQNGSITSNVTGGTGAYTYVWSNGATTPNLTDVAAGTYSVTVSDANGCTAVSNSATITIPSAVVASAAAGECTSTGCGGTASASATGGTGAYTYNWSNSATGSSVSELCNGTYYVTVTDANGCTDSASVVISCSPPPCTFPITINVNAPCGANSAALSVTGVPEGASTTYTWFADSIGGTLVGSGSTYTATTEGAYCVEVSVVINDFECIATTCTTVTFTDAPTVTVTGVNLPCFNPNNTGSATANVSGGVGPFTFLWSTGQTTQTINNKPAGTYSVTVTGSDSGCTATGSITLTRPPKIVAYTNCIKTCPGICSGTAIVYASGGTPPFTYLWSNGATASTITGLCAGVYWVTITDANGCIKVVGATVASYSALVINGNVSNPLCYGLCTGTITQTISGGGGAPYTYSWNDGATTKNRSGLCAGTYTVTVTSSKGCTGIKTYTITQPEPYTCTVTGEDTICLGGTSEFCASTASSYIWSTGATTQCIPVTSAGTYSVTTTNANGCTAVCSRTLVTNPLPACEISGSNFCYGGSTQLCTGEYAAYSWSTGDTTQCITVSESGTYYVTVTNSFGCTAVCNHTVTEYPEVNVTVNANDLSCYGICDGTATTTVTGGTAPYTYVWNVDSVTGIAIDGSAIYELCPGIYCVTVYDANGCSATNCDTINQPDSLIVDATSTDVTCYGACDGTADITVTGGTAPYTYVWNTLVDLDSLCSGEYCVTVYDAHQCSAVACVTIEQPLPLTTTSTSTDNTCFNESAGSISVTVDGGTPEYTIAWDFGSTEWTIDSLAAGIYCYTVTDANGCTADGCDTINEPEPLLAYSECPAEISCPGSCDGMIDVTVVGGTPDYTFLWNDGATTEDRDSLCAGTYSVTITDANGCTYDLTHEPFVNPDSIHLTLIYSDVTCYGECDGSATAGASGGTGDLSILWSNGDTTWTTLNLCPGEYCFVVTDENGCTAGGCVNVSQPDSLTAVVIPTDVTCYGLCNGLLDFAVQGGTPPFIIHLDTIVTTPLDPSEYGNGVDAITYVFGNLCPGEYCYTVTDMNGCSVVGCITIEEPAELEATPEITNILCYGDNTGSITVNVSGGTPDYTILWSNDSTTFTIDGLTAGEYCFTVTDANNCSTTGCVTVAQTDSLIVDATSTDVTCYGDCNGTATLTVIGGTMPYSFVWNTLVDLDSLCAGEYCVTVYDANQCSAVACVTIEQPLPLTASSTSTDNTCFDGYAGSITVTADGGTPEYSILWDFGSTEWTIDSLAAGIYCYTVTDANGCTAVGCDTINEPEPLLAYSECPAEISCPGSCDGVIYVYVIGGTPPYSYLWNDGATTQNRDSLCAGTYSVTITDANGCTYDLTHEPFVNPDSLTLGIETTQPTVCTGNCDGSIDITAGGGTPDYTYLWSDGSTEEDRDSLCAGFYGVTVTDANGCTISTGETLISLECPPCIMIVDATATDDTNCEDGICDGTISVDVVGGVAPYTYTWSSGASFSGVCAGTYSVTVTDVNGCSAADTVITVGCIPSPCDSLRTQTQGGWGAPPNGNNPGVYLHANFDAAFGAELVVGCVSGNTLTFTSAQAITNWLPSGSTPSALPGDLVDPNTGSNPDYNNVLAAQLVAATINVGFDYYDPNFGEGSNNLGDMTILSGPFMGWTVNELLAAANSAIGGCGTGGFTYSQYNEALTAINENYDDGNSDDGFLGCDSVPECDLSADASSVDDTNCADNLCNGSASVTPTGGTMPYSYAWSNGGTNSSISDLCGSIDGTTYYVTVTDANNCMSIDSATIYCIPPPPCEFPITIDGPATACSADGPVTLNIGIIPTIDATIYYNWSDGSNNLYLIVDSSGTYCVTVTVIDANGNACVGDTCITITFYECCNVTNGGNIGDNIEGCGEVCPGPLGPGTLPSGGSGTIEYQWLVSYIADDVFYMGDTNWHPISGATNSTYDPGCLTESRWFLRCSRRSGCNDYPGESNILAIIVNPVPSVSTEVTQPTVCTGACDGAIDLTVTGGTPEYTYLWNDGSVLGDRTDLCAGDYGVTVTDANGCTTSTGETLISLECPPCDISASADVTDDTNCEDSECDGTISITVNGGVAPITFAWSNGATTGSIASELCGGNYSVTVTDVNGCSTVVDAITVGCAPAPDCDTLTTFTQGGWGAVPNGNNPGVYLHANFDAAFPGDLTIGCDNTLTFTSAQAITNWLPSGTTPDALPAGNMVDPAGGSYNNVFAAQLVAATLNVTFDYYYADFDASADNLGDRYIAYGTFMGWTVNQLIAEANSAIGGCGSAYSYSELNAALDSINNNYDNGNSDDGFLTCTPSPARESEAAMPGRVNINAYPNPFSINSNIEFTLANDDNVTLEVYAVTGVKVAELFKGFAAANQTYSVKLDGSNLADAMYIYRLVTTNHTHTGSLIRVK